MDGKESQREEMNNRKPPRRGIPITGGPMI